MTRKLQSMTPNTIPVLLQIEANTCWAWAGVTFFWLWRWVRFLVVVGNGSWFYFYTYSTIDTYMMGQQNKYFEGTEDRQMTQH